MQEERDNFQNQNSMHQTKQYQQQETKSEKKDSKSEGRICKKCGALLSEDDKFCPECGEEIDGIERECRVCKTKTTAEFCPECGRRIIPLICPTCNVESYFDFCENCGKPLTKEVQEMFEAPVQRQVIQEMSEQEAKEIQKKAENYSSPELEKFEKAIKEHQILKQEKEYFQAREKRIKKVFGVHPYEIEFPDLEDEQYKQKAYQGLKETVIYREQEEIEEQLAKWRKEQETIEAEKRKQIKKEIESDFTQKTNAVEQAVKEEQLRLEEIERKRREEEERRRLEELQRKNGTYQYNCNCVPEHISQITINGDTFTGHDKYSGDTFRGNCTISGERITLTSTAVHGSNSWSQFSGSFSEYQFIGNWQGSSCACQHCYYKI